MTHDEPSLALSHFFNKFYFYMKRLKKLNPNLPILTPKRTNLQYLNQPNFCFLHAFFRFSS